MITTSARRRARRGMTLIEMMMALLIFSFVMAGALTVLRAESQSFVLGSERVAMYQNGRFAMNEMEKDLRTSGAGAPDIQPQMIYISDSVIVFNANYWTNTPGDVEAVYYNPDAPDSAVKALRSSTKITLPYTAIQYPDTSYVVGGVNSAAETISFHFALDSSTARTDDYLLVRRVNNLKPEIVATNILKTAGVPFFQYFRKVTPAAGGSGTLVQVTSGLPWRHSVPIHYSNVDTGTLARIDSIRAVRVSFTVSNGQTGDKERFRTLTRLILMPNAGLANTRSCGDQPIFAAAPAVAATVNGGGLTIARLTWTPSVDEASGEKDVERYLVWRRLQAVTDWGDPYVAVPAGDTLYQFDDAAVASGDSYYYAVAAQDCTPTLSDRRISNLVTIP
jgi:prepilin-type N-terminal cleavage/methylation domain-containing protein